MLTSVLDAGITEKVVRLGTRSSDERIAQYTLGELERRAGVSAFDRTMKQQYAIMKQSEEHLSNTIASIRLPLASWEEIEEFLCVHYGDHYESIQFPPPWISKVTQMKWTEEDLEGEFEEVRRKGKKRQTIKKPGHRTMYSIWREGVDIHFLQQTSPARSKPPKGNQGEYGGSSRIRSLLSNPRQLFASIGFHDTIPLVPRTNRPIYQLLRSFDVWDMSLAERARLADEWEADIRAKAYESQLGYYRAMKVEFEEECRLNDEMRDDVCSLPLRCSYACSTQFPGPSSPAEAD
uniref:N/A n=1 Tax=Ganoderma boninense TaxID=34458 RepID=A0A5K1JY10_9APHY|nr:N/A [Ganoderma boninense]